MARGRQAAAVPAPTTRTLRSQSRAKNAAGQQVAPATNQAVPIPPPPPAPAPAPAPAPPSVPADASPLHNLRSRSVPRVTPVEAPVPSRTATAKATKKRGRGDVAVDIPAADAPAQKRAKSGMPPPAQLQPPSELSAPRKKSQKKKKKGKKKPSTPAEEADAESELQDAIPATDDESGHIPPGPLVEVALAPLAPALVADIPAAAASAAHLPAAGVHASLALPASSGAALPNPFAPEDGQTATTFDGSPSAVLQAKCAINYTPADPEVDEEFEHHSYSLDSDDEDSAEGVGNSVHVCKWGGCNQGFKNRTELTVHVIGSHNDMIDLIMFMCSSTPESSAEAPVDKDATSTPKDDRTKDPDYVHPSFSSPLGPQRANLNDNDRKKYLNFAVEIKGIGGALRCAISGEVVEVTGEWVHHVARKRPYWMSWMEWIENLYVVSRLHGGTNLWLNADTSRNISRLSIPYHRALDGRLLAFSPSAEWLDKISAELDEMKASGKKKFPYYRAKFPDQMREFVLIPIVRDDGSYWRPCIHRRRPDLEESLTAHSADTPICNYPGCGRLFKTRVDLAEHLSTHAGDPAQDQASSSPETSGQTTPLVVKHAEDIFACSCRNEVYERHHWPYPNLIIHLWAHPYFVIFDLITKLPETTDLSCIHSNHWDLVAQARGIWKRFCEIVGPVPEEHITLDALPPHLKAKKKATNEREMKRSKATNDDDPQTPSDRKGRKP